MPTRTEINDLYSAANELKSVTKERDELRGAVARAIKAINEFEQEVAELKEKLAEYEKPRKHTVIDESALILEEGRYHKWEDEDGVDWEWFPADVECDTCIDVLLVRKDKFNELKERLTEYEKRFTAFTWDAAKESWVEINRT